MRTLRIELYVKTILLITLCTWIFISQEYINNDLTKSYRKIYQNINYSISDIVIMGGSNSRMGIRAEKIQYNAKNISISSEMGNFNNYLSFIKAKASNPKIIIYSSLNFWNYTDESILPRYSLILFIYILFNKENLDNINIYGDHAINNYKCIAFKSKSIKISKNNNDFIKRIKTIKSLYKNSRIIVRIPPLYVENEKIKKELFNYMLFSIKK